MGRSAPISLPQARINRSQNQQRGLHPSHPCWRKFTKVDRQIEGLLKSAEKREDPIPALQHALESRAALQILAPNMETLMSQNLNSSKGLYRDCIGEHYKGYRGGYWEFRLWLIWRLPRITGTFFWAVVLIGISEGEQWGSPFSETTRRAS